MTNTGASSNSDTPRHVYLIDGSGFIFRAFHALPPMNRQDGTPVNAVFGFCNMLMKMIDTADADCIAVIFDTARTTFRNEIYADYKANRDAPPEELVPQFEIVREATRAYGLPALELPGYEADDLIATYARMGREAGAKVTIVSSDKDLMQLVGDQVQMLDPMKMTMIGSAEVVEKFGVSPNKVVEVQSLAGDSTDNVPGVPGIGIKTAALLINEFGDLETLLERAGEIKQPKRRQNLIDFAEQARISRKLVTLDDHSPVEASLADMAKREPEPQVLLDFLKSQGFNSIFSKVEAFLAGEGKIEVAESRDPEPVENNYELIQTEAALDEWIAAARAQHLIAVDTETTSLDAQQASLVGVSLALSPGRACYIPLGHRGPLPEGELNLGGELSELPDQIPLSVAMPKLRELFEDPSVLKVGQNLKYDMGILAKHGINLSPIDDVMLLSFVLDAGLHGHGMDELARFHLDYETIKFTDVAGKGKDQVSFDQVPLDKALSYAAEDADVTLRLYQLLKPRLIKDRLAFVYEGIERPLAPVLASMEAEGVLVDKARLEQLSSDFGLRLISLEAQIHKLAGREFNVGSPKQLGEILFDEMGLKGGKKGKTGAWSTDSNVLESLAAEGHELPTQVLDWRQIQKLKSTYADALQTYINPTTGRIHTSFAMTGAATGRLSSSDPNLQNIPIRTEEGRKLRSAFVASKGSMLISADYSQIELRLLAHVADILELKNAFSEGVDIHASTAALVFGGEPESIDPDLRRKAKAINFGIIYGISAFGLARQLGVPQGEARDFIEAYFDRYPGVKAYMDRAKSFAHEHGFVTTCFGRRIWTPGISDKNPARRGFQERAAINAPLQGAAADIIKIAMAKMQDALDRASLAAKMILQVHDELLFEAPESEVEQTAGVVREVMESAVSLSVPLLVETGVAKTWAEAH